MSKFSQKLIQALVLSRGHEHGKALHALVDVAEAGGEDADIAKVALQMLRSFGALRKELGGAAGRAFSATPSDLVITLLEAQGFTRGGEKDIMGKTMIVMTRGSEEIFVPFFKPKSEATAADTAAA